MARTDSADRPKAPRAQRALSAAQHAAEHAEEQLEFVARMLRDLDAWWRRSRVVDGRECPSKAQRAECLIDTLAGAAAIAWVVRPSVTVALMLAALLILPDQSIDAFQELSEGAGGLPGTLLITAGALFLASLSLWHWARAAVYTFAPADMPADVPGYRAGAGRRRGRSWFGESRHRVRRCYRFATGWWRAPHLGWATLGRRWCARYLPRIAGVVPLLGCAVGALRALLRRPDPLGGDMALVLLLIAALVGAGLQWAAFAKRARVFGSQVVRPRGGSPAGNLRNLNALSRVFLVIWLVLATGLMFLFTVWSWLAVQFAPLGLLAVSAALAVSFGSMLVWVDYRTRIPTLPVLLLLAVWFSGCDWNDNHTIRRLAAPPAARRPVLGEAFEQWLGARKDSGEARPYPIVLVCAEGGGIYAAYFSALALSEIQRIEPELGRHIFAISGVSGGSVGGSVYVALTKQQAAATGNWSASRGTPATYTASAHGVLARDFLSPVLSFALFPDLVQRFLPVPVRGFDRARALERAFEEGMRRATGGSEMAEGFDALWTPAGPCPALVLNTTMVETGERIAIAPFVFDGAPEWKLRTLSELAPGTRLRLSTAAGASARFPFVTPAARVPGTVDRAGLPAGAGRLADGGYFDNSGADTVKDILNIIVPADAGRTGGARFAVLVVRIGAATENPRSKFGWQGLGESMSPLRTLLNTRGARGRTGLAELRQLVERINAGGTRAGWVDLLLDTDADRIPLGWLLSQRARNAILAQLDITDLPGTGPSTKTSERAAKNRLAMEGIAEFVRTGRLPDERRDEPGSPTKQMRAIEK